MMNLIESEFLNPNCLRIKNVFSDNQRKFMKLKIFLNANKLITYTIESNYLKIFFSINDRTLISKEIEKISSFIEKSWNIKINFDTKTKESLRENTQKLSLFKNALSNLEKLKSSDITKNEQFQQYCKFCDDTLSCKLRPYQYSASFFLTIGQGGFDFSVPGSGKTIITYATYNYLKKNNLCDTILIIGPINSYNAWQDEYETCFDKKPDFQSLANFSKNDASIYLLSSPKNHNEITFINVDKAWRMKNEIIQFVGNKNVLLIIDEAHKEKNPEAEITKAVMEITKYVKYRIILTGTPMPNGYEDLFSLMKIYEPYEKILPFNYSDLKKITKNGATEQQQNMIMQSIKPIYSRVSKAHLINTGELRVPNYHFITCELSDNQKALYEFLNKKSYEINDDYESLLNTSLMKAILIRKMQVSANPGLLSKSIISSIDEYKKEYLDSFESEDTDNEALLRADKTLCQSLAQSSIAKLIYKFEANFLDTSKNVAAVDLALTLADKGQKVIIWDVFVQNMLAIKKLIEKKSDYKNEMINGSVVGLDRDKAISNFKNGNSMILIANPATLAESISLHKVCQNAIYVNRNFNAAQFIQSKDRIHRINMPKGTTANYYFLINRDTVDEAVQERLKIKEDRMLKILDTEEIEIGGGELENTAFMSIEDAIYSFRR